MSLMIGTRVWMKEGIDFLIKDMNRLMSRTPLWTYAT